MGRDHAAEIELTAPVDLLPLQAGERDRAAAVAIGGGPERHPAVALEALDLLRTHSRDSSEVLGVRELERADDEPLGLDRQLDSQPFSQTDTCFVLSAVNGARSQSAQRSRSLMPASRAIRSSSARETAAERNRDPPPLAVHEREMMRDESLRREVELVDADVLVAQVEHLEPLPVVDSTSTTKQPPGARCAAAFANTPT